MSANQPLNLFWLRRDLRLTDNHGLYRALTAGLPVLPVFIFDPQILDRLSDKRDRRVRFIWQALMQINRALKPLGRQIHIFYGRPEAVFEKLTTTYPVHSVYCNRDYEPQAIARDKRVKALLKKRGISWKSFKDQVVFEESEIMKADGTPYTVYSPYRRRWESALNADQVQPFPSEEFLRNLTDIPAKPFRLDETGFELPVDDQNLLQPDFEQIAEYHNTRDFPALDGTTRVGVHLRFGTVSIRHLVRKALDLNDTWLGELIWREFFMMILYQFPHVIDKPFRAKYNHFPWRTDPRELARWKAGQTGYPLVDAGMRELNASGFMHNRVRMVTASFLTKHLLIDYRTGEDYFAEKLLDFDLAANNGNWQWVAGCGCDAAPYFRIFNPYTQAQKFDSQNGYIQKWVPEFRDSSYVKPILEHRSARERALAAYKSIR